MLGVKFSLSLGLQRQTQSLLAVTQESGRVPGLYLNHCSRSTLRRADLQPFALAFGIFFPFFIFFFFSDNRNLDATQSAKRKNSRTSLLGFRLRHPEPVIHPLVAPTLQVGPED